MIEFKQVGKWQVHANLGHSTVAIIRLWPDFKVWRAEVICSGVDAPALRAIATKLDELNGMSDESRG